jgi:hypothetical protein
MPGKVAGTLRVEGNAVSLAFEGALAAQPVTLHLATAGGRLTGGHAGGVSDFDVAAPPALGEAVIVGFLGLGALPGLVRLSAGQPPDHLDGGVRARVHTTRHAWGEPAELGGRPARPLWFAVVVDGQPVADATLWLDRETGLPLMRRQAVRWGGGELSVVESYRRFDVAPAAPAVR